MDVDDALSKLCAGTMCLPPQVPLVSFHFNCSRVLINKYIENYTFNSPYLEESDGSQNHLPRRWPSPYSQCGKCQLCLQARVLQKSAREEPDMMWADLQATAVTLAGSCSSAWGPHADVHHQVREGQRAHGLRNCILLSDGPLSGGTRS